MKVLVTGANGMIGSQLVKELLASRYEVIAVDRVAGVGITQVDLADKEKLREIAKLADRFIHLAALAHRTQKADFSWEQYKRINVDCAKNVFDVAGDRPVLFISTVDVFGFYDGKEPVNESSPIAPVSSYGKSKAMAEEECRKSVKHFTIFRFSPVYTDEIKRDIQKRYYLKYPWLAYQVGNGTSYEILNIRRAVAEMVAWCGQEPENNIRIIKDDKTMWTPDYIKAEKAAGRAKIVLRLPRWLVNAGYNILRAVLGKNEKTYLLNKAVHPLRTV